MLGEYIEEYEKALLAGDKSTMRRIEKEIARVGVDKRSLLVIVAERKKNGK